MTSAGSRHFVIGNEKWTVREEQKDGPLRRGPALIFENEKVARRVRDYPVNWRDLTDMQLAALSWLR
jgi:hypothetical protein